MYLESSTSTFISSFLTPAQKQPKTKSLKKKIQVEDLFVRLNYRGYRPRKCETRGFRTSGRGFAGRGCVGRECEKGRDGGRNQGGQLEAPLACFTFVVLLLKEFWLVILRR